MSGDLGHRSDPAALQLRVGVLCRRSLRLLRPCAILMRNPRTDNVVVCRHELFTMSTTECAEKLEREGWLRIR